MYAYSGISPLVAIIQLPVFLEEYGLEMLIFYGFTASKFFILFWNDSGGFLDVIFCCHLPKAYAHGSSWQPKLLYSCLISRQKCTSNLFLASILGATRKHKKKMNEGDPNAYLQTGLGGIMWACYFLTNQFLNLTIVVIMIVLSVLQNLLVFW